MHINSVRSMFIGSNEVLLVVSMSVKDEASGSEIEQDTKELKFLIEQAFPEYKFEIFIEIFEY